MTSRLRERWNNHRSGMGGVRALTADIKQFGVDSFTFVVLVVTRNFDDANAFERQMIAEKSTRCPRGYNSTDGAVGSFGLDAESREKLALVFRGKRQSPEQIKKRVEARQKTIGYTKLNWGLLAITRCMLEKGASQTVVGSIIGVSQSKLSTALLKESRAINAQIS